MMIISVTLMTFCVTIGEIKLFQNDVIWENSQSTNNSENSKITKDWRSYFSLTVIVLYIQDALEGENKNRRVFLDPNKLFPNATVALTSTQQFSKDGSLFAYGVSISGSDWQKVYFCNVSSNKVLGDVLVKVKFTKLVWKGNEGVFYGHYPDFKGIPGSDNGTNENQKISFHRIGTRQEDDVVVVAFPEKPRSLITTMYVTTKDDCLIVTPEATPGDGTLGSNTVYYVDLAGNNPSNWRRRPLVETFNAEYKFVTDYNGILYFITNLNAPRYKIVGIRTVSSPEPKSWTTLIEEDPQNVLEFAAPINRDYILLHYLENVASKLVLRSLIAGNSFTKQIPLENGTVYAYSGKIADTQLFVKFESFLVPNRIYKLDFKTPVDQIQLEVFDDVEIEGLDLSLFEVRQVRYSSKDGTQVPMYIVHKKDFVLNATSPAMLYGYGGFATTILPRFSVPWMVFAQSFNGVVAVANIRGGGEFGSAWHKAGNLLNKQNVFDDFQAAAEYLIAKNYTNAQKIIIEGASNGGLLVGACVNQRPDLYGAAVASVGLMDMLRFHKFTIGHTWVLEYGNPENSTQFPYIYGYSPLHNIKFPEKEGVQYPAVLVTTSDHDDRVVPGHSYKYIAELQHTIGRHENQTHPLLLRVEANAGHGAGLPTSKLIEKKADILSFLAESLDLPFEGRRKEDKGSDRTAVFSTVGTMLPICLVLSFILIKIWSKF